MNRKEFRDFLESKIWKFAKTYSRKAPHWYTLRKQWSDDTMFDNAVQQLRDYAGIQWFWRKPYQVFEIDGWRYWTMGAPIKDTILINKTVAHNQYNTIADHYDGLFIENQYKEEDNELAEILKEKIKGKYVCDIGCGTGLLLDMIKIERQDYIGIDPSNKMIQIARQKHYGKKFLIDRFETYDQRHFKDRDVITVSLFGSMNYVIRDCLKYIKDYGKNYFLMFYKKKYYPVTYKRTGKDFFHYKYTMSELKKIFRGAEVREYNNYYIVEK